MSLLSRPELVELVNTAQPLVEEMVNPEIQVQPNGVELTLKWVEELTGAGAVAYDNSERVLSSTKPREFDAEGWVHLEPGAYKVVFNEVVNLPLDMAAIARPRSSLLRCGVTLETAVWDAGYSGRSESLLVVHNPHGFKLKKNARIMQLLFFKLETPDERGYEGIYQNENK